MRKSTKASYAFDVVIPAYNNLQQLQACLKGLEHQTFKSFRALICVDGSTDGTLKHLSHSDYAFDYKILTHPDGMRHGPAAARNLSLRHLASTFVCFIDSDMVPDSGLLENHWSLLSQGDAVSLGEIVYANAGTSMVAAYLGSRGRGKRRHGDRIPAFHMTTGNAALPSRCFSALGGMDRHFRSPYYGDDLEFGYRLQRRFGIPVIVNKRALTTTVETKTLDELLRRMQSFGSISVPYLRKKHPEFDAYFRVRLFDPRCRWSTLVRKLVRTSLPQQLERCASYAPAFLQTRLVHLLVFLHIGKGYFSADTRP